jgi:phage tail sheath protein FI
MPVGVSPGVYASERDFSLYAPQLASSIFGIVTTASKGPVNELTLISDEGSLVGTFGLPSAQHLGLYAGLRYLKRGKQLLVVRVAAYDSTASVFVPLRTVEGGGSLVSAATISALSSGSWGNDISCLIERSSYYTGKIKITVRYKGAIVETFDNLSTDTSDTTNYWETKVNGNSEYITLEVLDPAGRYIDGTSYTATLSGGDDGAPADTSDIIGSAGSPPSVPATGLQLFRNSEAVDLNLLAVPGNSDASVISELISICEARGDAMALIDPPFGYSVQEVADWHNGLDPSGPVTPLSSSYAALFWPWIKVYDGFSDSEVWVPPSGHIAGVIAYTDYVADPWWAPAGMTRAILSDALQVEYSASLGERDFLYSGANSINPICSFYGQGIVVWGQRTLQRSTSALDRINVRRLLLYLRKVVSSAVRQLVFEPNDELTWMMFVNLVQPICDTIQSRRGIYRSRVICDETTNTPDVVARNEMRGKILIQPTKTAEVITLEFTLLPTGATFEEYA